MRFEYRVIPAPAKGRRERGVKTPEARFAHAVEAVLNDMAAQGWEYQRAELLPSEERSGLTGTSTRWRNLLIFRRPAAAPAEAVPAIAAPAAPEAAGEAADDGQTAAPAIPAPARADGDGNGLGNGAGGAEAEEEGVSRGAAGDGAGAGQDGPAGDDGESGENRRG